MAAPRALMPLPALEAIGQIGNDTYEAQKHLRIVPGLNSDATTERTGLFTSSCLGFLDLPMSVRNRIYEHVLTDIPGLKLQITLCYRFFPNGIYYTWLRIQGRKQILPYLEIFPFAYTSGAVFCELMSLALKQKEVEVKTIADGDTLRRVVYAIPHGRKLVRRIYFCDYLSSPAAYHVVGGMVHIKEITMMISARRTYRETLDWNDIPHYTPREPEDVVAHYSLTKLMKLPALRRITILFDGHLPDTSLSSAWLSVPGCVLGMLGQYFDTHDARIHIKHSSPQAHVFEIVSY